MSQYQRVVCFKFKPDAGDAAIRRHMEAFAALRASIPEIREYSGGRTVGGESETAPEWDSMHYLTFDSEEDIRRYFAHEAHQEFIRSNRDSWERALVLNARIDAESSPSS